MFFSANNVTSNLKENFHEGLNVYCVYDRDLLLEGEVQGNMQVLQNCFRFLIPYFFT